MQAVSLAAGSTASTIETEAFSAEPGQWNLAKRAIDMLLATIMIVCAAPVIVVLMLLAGLDGGPSLFGHVRVGRKGREFRCLKFRSMVVDAEQVLHQHLATNYAAQLEWDESHKLTNDPRVTRLGAVLRATSLDELPQLFNVLRGDMSLVGPRPVSRTELNRFYGKDGQEAYLSIRPGLTGLWQVSGRSDITYARRVALDKEYVRTRSPALDAAILWRTVGVVMRGTGAR